MVLGDKLIPKDIQKTMPIPKRPNPWDWLCTGTLHNGNTPCDHRVIQFGHTDKDGNYRCNFCGMKIMRTGSYLKDKLDNYVKKNHILNDKFAGRKSIGIRRI